MELALLSDVAGRGGGKEEPIGGVAMAALVEADRAVPSIGGGAASEDGAGLLDSDGGAPADDGGLLSGPKAMLAAGGTVLPLALLLGGPDALGGGGVPRDTLALFGSFLLTHFFNSLS